MCKKMILLWVGLALCLSPAVQAAKIIFVSENNDRDTNGVIDDKGWVDILVAQGHTVDFRLGNWMVLDAGKIAALGAADLIIVSRGVNSGNYNQTGEAAQWNSLKVPLLSMSVHVLRSTHWAWVSSTSLQDNIGAPKLEVLVPSHPVFSGVQLDANKQVQILDSKVGSGRTAFLNLITLGNGKLLAKVAGQNITWIAEWEPGTAFYPGGSQIPAGRRMIFSGGNVEAGTFPQGAYNFTEEGKAMWLNAVNYLLGATTQKGRAAQPVPASGATDVRLDGILSWTPGPYAATHDVYLGTNQSDVSNASRANPLGVLVSQGQDANTYDPSALQLEKTYYWRVDEVNRAPDTTIIKGSVWSFTVEPTGYLLAGKSITATASSVNSANMGPEKTIDGSGLNASGQHSNDPTTMWLSSKMAPQPAWIQYAFDRVYKLHQMRVWNSNQILEPSLGFGAKSVTIEYSLDGTVWAALPKAEFPQASGEATYASASTVNFGGAVAQYVRLTINSNWGGLLPQYGLSEVQFFYMPVVAREPSPASGAVGVNPQVILSWRPGREAVSHQVYLSPEQQKVRDGTALVATVPETRWETTVDLAQTYYWKVIEVNNAAHPNSWDGDVWSFSTPDYLTVDDFESYTDDVGKEIYTTWVDGYGTKTNGAIVGNEKPPFAERTNLHGGKQAMPLTYDNTSAANSEAQRSFTVSQDWTKSGVTTLVVYFCGSPANTGGPLYVKINGTKKVTYSGALTKPWWTQWNIDLKTLGLNLQKVTALTIGVEGSGKGIVYVDDLRLYKSAPSATAEEIVIEAESAKTVPNTWALLSDKPDASGGKYLGVKAGNNSMDVPPATDGTITYPFTVKGGTYTIRARTIVPTADDNSLWLRVRGATPSTAIHADGWVWWYDIAVGAAWHWDVVRSHDDGDKTVRFTLPAGSYNLEIAYREDGLLVDAFLITDQLD